MAQNIKNCPFCGGKAKIRMANTKNYAYKVLCEDCGASGPNALVKDWHKDKFIAQGNAIAAWNKRV